MASHKEKILNHLKANKTITSIEAIHNFQPSITRLAAVIYDLKKDGYIIDSRKVHKKNRDGDNINFAEYTLVGSKQKSEVVDSANEYLKMTRGY